MCRSLGLVKFTGFSSSRMATSYLTVPRARLMKNLGWISVSKYFALVIKVSASDSSEISCSPGKSWHLKFLERWGEKYLPRIIVMLSYSKSMSPSKLCSRMQWAAVIRCLNRNLLNWIDALTFRNRSLMREPPHLDVSPLSEDERFSKAAHGNSLTFANSPPTMFSWKGIQCSKTS